MHVRSLQINQGRFLIGALKHLPQAVLCWFNYHSLKLVDIFKFVGLLNKFEHDFA